MIADISHGHVTFADWFFLIAAVLFVLAAVLAASARVERPTWLNTATLTALGLACVAVAWIAL